jgi:dihydroorotate dehydrogenase subfamily 2
MKPLISLSRAIYRGLFRPIFFRFDSENIHVFLTNTGEWMGRSRFMTALMRHAFRVDNPALTQTVAGIRFENPIGLAAGFDYRAQISNILPAIGFGFGTIGTITNQPYEGNPRPRLGRLIRSRSILVNKGFKNDGIDAVVKKLSGRTFSFPVGLSLGKTNTREVMTQEEGIADVVSAFKKAEASHIPFAYYELNISCPNLYGTVTFYPPKNLRALLLAVTGLRLSRPLFIKMPIEKTNDETLEMFRVIVDFPVVGVILGNLQKDRDDPAFVKEEIERAGQGNFSGIPTRRRSNELIQLTYREFGKKLLIIGCGGVMSPEGAYRKIRLGATLIQLITGMIYEGPQLAAELNAGIATLLKKDGFMSVSDAIGRDA